MAVVKQKAKVEDRELFREKCKPYQERIKQALAAEKTMLAGIQEDEAQLPYKKFQLSEDVLSIAADYMQINNLSVELINTKNNDALNDARKIIYKSIIYLEEIVTPAVDVAYNEISDKVDQIADITVEKRFYLVRKLGLTIQLLEDAFGENSKWKLSFIEIHGRAAVVAKNLLDWKQACKVYFDSSLPEFDETMRYIRLVRQMLDLSSTQYRDKYELSSRRMDDLRRAIQFVLAERRICMALSETEDADKLKSKAQVWKDKLDAENKKGVAK
ncbi:MAG: hypothetical protein J1E32_04675 [Treponema sp.]|nr:hypothetical protein [Treponema sp.]